MRAEINKPKQKIPEGGPPPSDDGDGGGWDPAKPPPKKPNPNKRPLPRVPSFDSSVSDATDPKPPPNKKPRYGGPPVPSSDPSSSDSSFSIVQSSSAVNKSRLPKDSSIRSNDLWEVRRGIDHGLRRRRRIDPLDYVKDGLDNVIRTVLHNMRLPEKGGNGADLVQPAVNMLFDIHQNIYNEAPQAQQDQ